MLSTQHVRESGVVSGKGSRDSSTASRTALGRTYVRALHFQEPCCSLENCSDKSLEEEVEAQDWSCLNLERHPLSCLSVSQRDHKNARTLSPFLDRALKIAPGLFLGL